MLVIVALAALLGQSGAVLAADTIEFANGELASGTFKQASPAGVMIEIGGHDVVFPLDKVKAIHFGRPPAAAAAPAPSTQVPATLSTSAPVSAPPAPASTPVDVAGKWVGEWFSFGISRYAEMSLWQEAEKITGTLELRQASNFGYVPKKLTGTLTGGQLTLTVPADRCLFNAELLFTTAAAEDRLEGPSECAGNSQTLRFSRRKRP